MERLCGKQSFGDKFLEALPIGFQFFAIETKHLAGRHEVAPKYSKNASPIFEAFFVPMGFDRRFRLSAFVAWAFCHDVSNLFRG